MRWINYGQLKLPKNQSMKWNRKQKTVNLLSVFVGLFIAVGLLLQDANFATPPSYTHIYEQGILERLDVEGHAIERHVGKTDMYLKRRLATEDISAASTFINMAEADYAVRMVLSERQTLIQKWLELDRSDTKAFYYPSDKPVGRIFKREWTKPRPGNQIRIVLRRDNDYSEGFHFVTAYPELK